MGFYDRWHLWVEETRTGRIITKDLIPQELSVLRILSGPSQIEFKVHYNEPSVQIPGGQGPIIFKPYGHYIHAVKEDQAGNEKIWATGIFQPSDVDSQTGVLSVKATGFSDYLKGIPWLENWNPIAVDPAEIFTRAWAHAQSYANGNLGVKVTNLDGSMPASTGTQMLPGFSFEGEEFVQDFFAIFIREVDRNDLGDYVNKIARDIPVDYLETSEWNPDTRKVDKSIRLAYPKSGVDQTDLIFRLGENVKAAQQKIESEINWFSDVTVKGYFPGKQYSSTLANADPDRLRRVMDEQDLHIDSNERAAAWAHRRLSRRQIPHYFESMTVEPYHWNAPFMSYDVGDTIRYQGPMHWHGMIDQKHRVMMMGWDETKGELELKTMAEGAFNYDPIQYVPPGGTP